MAEGVTKTLLRAHRPARSERLLQPTGPGHSRRSLILSPVGSECVSFSVLPGAEARGPHRRGPGAATPWRGHSQGGGRSRSADGGGDRRSRVADPGIGARASPGRPTSSCWSPNASGPTAEVRFTQLAPCRERLLGALLVLQPMARVILPPALSRVGQRSAGDRACLSPRRPPWPHAPRRLRPDRSRQPVPLGPESGQRLASTPVREPDRATSRLLLI